MHLKTHIWNTVHIKYFSLYPSKCSNCQSLNTVYAESSRMLALWIQHKSSHLLSPTTLLYVTKLTTSHVNGNITTLNLLTHQSTAWQRLATISSAGGDWLTFLSLRACRMRSLPSTLPVNTTRMLKNTEETAWRLVPPLHSRICACYPVSLW